MLGAVGCKGVGADLQLLGVDVHGNNRCTGVTEKATDGCADATAPCTHYDNGKALEAPRVAQFRHLHCSSGRGEWSQGDAIRHRPMFLRRHESTFR